MEIDYKKELIKWRTKSKELQALKRMNEEKKNELIKKAGYDIDTAIEIEEKIYLMLTH